MTKEIAPIDELRKNLDRMKGEFEKVLPVHVSSDKFTRVVVTMLQGNKALLEANRNSLYSACLKAATDGLLLDGREAALVVFKTKVGPVVQYMPMYQGILKKVRNSGELATISAQVVYEKDYFKYFTDDSGDHISHVPDVFNDRGAFLGVFAMAITKDSARYIEVMGLDEIQKVRNISKMKDSGPWVEWFEEMAKKTVIRRLSKRLPSSTDIDQVFERDIEIEKEISEKPELPVPLTTSNRLSKIITEKEADELMSQSDDFGQKAAE